MSTIDLMIAIDTVSLASAPTSTSDSPRGATMLVRS